MAGCVRCTRRPRGGGYLPSAPSSKQVAESKGSVRSDAPPPRTEPCPEQAWSRYSLLRLRISRPGSKEGLAERKCFELLWLSSAGAFLSGSSSAAPGISAVVPRRFLPSMDFLTNLLLHARNRQLSPCRYSRYLLWLGIGRDFRRLRVWLNQPDMPALVEANQFEIIGGIHLPRPDHFGAIDVRRVIDPLIEGIMLGRISDHHQLFSRQLLQSPFDTSSLRAELDWTIPITSPVGRWPFGTAEMKGADKQPHSGKRYDECHQQPYPAEPDGPAIHPHQSQVAHCLKTKRIEDNRERRQIMRDEIYLDNHPGHHDRYTRNQKAGAAVPEHASKHQQRRQQNDAGKEQKPCDCLE